MKNILFKIIFICALFTISCNVFASTSTLILNKKKSTYRIPILVYHSIDNKIETNMTKMQIHYQVTPKTFEKQMQYLKDNNYHPITFKKYVDSFRNYVIRLPEKAVVITFDDGWKNQYENAVPILEKYNFTATFFIVTNYVNHKGYMMWDNLNDLVVHNFEIGSHTKTHPVLSRIDYKQLSFELSESKNILEEKLGIKIRTIAYPNYAENEAVRDSTKVAGYFGARVGRTNYYNNIDHMYQLKAEEVLNNPNPFSEKRISDLP